MQERLACLLRMYHNNEYLLKQNPLDFETMAEQEIIFQKMEECIPWEHCDEISLLVYGIRRVM